jgi:hypothetical protein
MNGTDAKLLKHFKDFLMKFVCNKKILTILKKKFKNYTDFYEIREGSAAGSVPLTNGSGSRMPKNMRILWIWIPNTASNQAN